MKQFLLDEAVPLLVLTVVVTMMVMVAYLTIKKVKYADNAQGEPVAYTYFVSVDKLLDELK